MPVAEAETGIQLFFPEHDVGVLLSESDALKTVAVICEAVVSRGWSGKAGAVRIDGDPGGEITVRIKRHLPPAGVGFK